MIYNNSVNDVDLWHRRLESFANKHQLYLRPSYILTNENYTANIPWNISKPSQHPAPASQLVSYIHYETVV